MKNTILMFSLLPLIFLNLGCGKSKKTTTSSTMNMTNANAVVCDSSKFTLLTLSPNLTLSGTGKIYAIRLTNATQTALIVGQNNLSFEVIDSSGQTITNANIVVAKPWMPEHGHGSQITPTVNMTNSTYTANDLYLFMPGIWQFSLQITANNKNDTIPFYTCVSN